MVNDAGKSLNEIRRDSQRAALAHHDTVDEQTVSVVLSAHASFEARAAYKAAFGSIA